MAGIFLLLLGSIAMAQSVSRLGQVADTLAHDFGFAGSVLVAKGDRILLDRSYGDANVEWHIHNRKDTRFRLGSVTKQFTAASVLLLQGQGKLKLTDTIGQHLSELPLAWREVTIQHLLTHTSGIHSFTDVPEYANLQRFPRTPGAILAIVRALPLDFESGTRYDYSNSNYVLLGMVIEKLSGDSYAGFVQKNIFDRLGMKDSGYDSNTAIVPNRAAGYRDNSRTPSRGEVRNADYIDMSVPYAAGALYSTSGDLLRWQRALYEGRLLTPGALQAMTTPARDGYALGLVVKNGAYGKQIGHGGNIEGFSTRVGYGPAERISVILLSNIEGRDLEAMERALFRVARGQPVLLPSERKAVAVAPGWLRKVAGTYATLDGTRFRVKLRDGRLSARLGSQPWIPIFAEANDDFFARTVDAQFKVLRSGGGRIHGLTLIHDGKRIDMQRSAEAAPDYMAVPLFLRGEMNDWGISAPLRMTDAHTFTVTLKLNKLRYAFKIGSEDFKAIDIGALDGRDVATLGTPLELEEYGQNLQIDTPEPGNYQFTLDTKDALSPRLTIRRAADL